MWVFTISRGKDKQASFKQTLNPGCSILFHGAYPTYKQLYGVVRKTSVIFLGLIWGRISAAFQFKN